MSTRFVTPPGRVSYPNLFKAVDQFDTGTPKFQLTLAWPKGTDMSQFETALLEAAVAKFGATAAPGIVTKSNALHDGDIDAPDDPNMAGYIFVRLNSIRKPEVVNARRDPILGPESPDEVYAGCMARASINAYAYDKGKGNKGVTFGLNNVQKVADGDRIDGGKSAAEDFDEIGDEIDPLG